MSPTYLRFKHTNSEFQNSTASMQYQAQRPLYELDADEPRNAPKGNGPKAKRKRPHHKFTTGCIDCKAMHIKCDEAQPYCRRCTRVGRQCRGYVVRKAWIFELECGSKRRSSIVSPGAARPSDALGTGSERRHLHFFNELIVPAMATWQFTRSAQDFWLHYVRQSIQSTKAVRLLATALASRLEGSMAPSDSQSRASCEQYMHGLSALTRAEEATSTETTLICSQMIAVYEYLNPIATAPEGLSHFAATLRILKHPTTTPSPLITAVSSVVHQLDMLMSVFKPPVFLPGGEPIETATQHLSPPPTLPAQFRNSVEMHHALFEIYRWRFVYGFTQHGEEWTPNCTAFHQIQSLMLKWYSLAEDFIHCLEVSQKAQKPSLGSSLLERRCAAAQSTYMRMMYTALHYSVAPTDPKAAQGPHRPLRPNFANLSDPGKVVVLVPIADSPVHDFALELEEWRLAANGSGSHKRAVAPWPEVGLVYASSGRPAYVQFTNNKSPW